MDIKLTSVKELTKRYKVSRQVIYKRMKHLGLEFIRGQDGLCGKKGQKITLRV